MLQSIRQRLSPRNKRQKLKLRVNPVSSFVKNLPENVMQDPETLHELLINACLNGESLSNIRYFAEENQDYLSSLSPQERSRPVTAYCSNMQPQLQVMRYLVEQTPESLKTTDKFGGLPLHYVCFKGCQDLKVIQYLIEKYPEALRRKTAQGKTCRELALLAGNIKIAKFVTESELKYYPEEWTDGI